MFLKRQERTAVLVEFLFVLMDELDPNRRHQSQVVRRPRHTPGWWSGFSATSCHSCACLYPRINTLRSYTADRYTHIHTHTLRMVGGFIYLLYIFFSVSKRETYSIRSVRRGDSDLLSYIITRLAAGCRCRDWFVDAIYLPLTL